LHLGYFAFPPLIFFLAATAASLSSSPSRSRHPTAAAAGSRAPLHGEQQTDAPLHFPLPMASLPSSASLCPLCSAPLQQHARMSRASMDVSPFFYLWPTASSRPTSLRPSPPWATYPARPSPPLCFPVRAQSFHGRRPKLQPFPAPCWRAAQQVTHGWRPENSSRLPSSSSPISSSSQQAIPSAVQGAASFSRPCQQHTMAGSAPSMGIPCCSLRPALSIQHAPFSSMEKPAASPLPHCSSWCPPTVCQNVQQAARCSSPPVHSPLPRRESSLSCLLRSEQHVEMPAGCLLFLRSPIVVVVHPGETATLHVRFRIDIIFL
jgi:hypothetical protein